MRNPMENRCFEAHLQNLMNEDVLLDKQIAQKLKILNQKLHMRTINDDLIMSEMRTRNKELFESEAKLQDNREQIDFLTHQINSLRPQIQRLRNKTDVPLQKMTACKLSDTDRSIHNKNQLKLKVLKKSTNLHIIDNHSSPQIKVIVGADGELIPYDIRAVSSKGVTNELWNIVTENSEHKKQWEDLFAVKK